MCNPLGAASASIVEWSAIERCRADYSIERVHLEADQLLQIFGQFNPSSQSHRQSQIHDYLRDNFRNLFAAPLSHQMGETSEVIRQHDF
jgi:hypothetical protein